MLFRSCKLLEKTPVMVDKDRVNYAIINSLSNCKVIDVVNPTLLAKAMKNNIEVEKRIIRDIDLVEVDGAFISGTTVGVLPIRSIESIVLNSQNSELIKKIIKGYQELQQEYINERK